MVKSQPSRAFRCDSRRSEYSFMIHADPGSHLLETFPEYWWKRPIFLGSETDERVSIAGNRCDDLYQQFLSINEGWEKESGRPHCHFDYDNGLAMKLWG